MFKQCLLLVLLIACLSACGPHSTTSGGGGGGYDTIPDHPNQDSARAGKLNSEGMAQLDQGQRDDAEQTFKAAIQADLTFGPAHNNLGKVYYAQKRFYLAAWEFEYAAKLMPHRPEPRNNLGLVYEAVGKLNDAVNAYQQATDLEPDNTEPLGNLARAMLRRGDKGPEMRQLLTHLLMRETRPDWRQWAEQRLALMGSETTPPTQY